jgi:hypothetical protein
MNMTGEAEARRARRRAKATEVDARRLRWREALKEAEA